MRLIFTFEWRALGIQTGFDLTWPHEQAEAQQAEQAEGPAEEEEPAALPVAGSHSHASRPANAALGFTSPGTDYRNW